MIPLLCSCGDAALTQPTLEACEQKIGQIQKIVIQRKYQSGTTLNKFIIGTSNPNVLASWTPLKSAIDSTKIITLPFVIDPTSEAGEPIREGGGNASLNGIATVEGHTATPFSAKLKNVKQSVVEDLKKLECEELGVYLVDNYGQIIGHTDDHSSPTDFLPIPIASQAFGDLTFGGFEASNKNLISWFFNPQWSNKLHVVTPTDFDALAEL